MQAAADYRQTTGDNMQYCANFDGQGFTYTKDADCHTPSTFYRGSYYAVSLRRACGLELAQILAFSS